MTPEQQQRMAELVQQIQVEQDHKKFAQLVSELQALLAEKDKRLEQSKMR